MIRTMAEAERAFAEYTAVLDLRLHLANRHENGAHWTDSAARANELLVAAESALREAAKLLRQHSARTLPDDVN